MKYQKGDTLKLSEVGLDWLYKYCPTGREKASQRRFEYRSEMRGDAECITVIRLGKGYYEHYHKSFLERA